MLIVCPNCATTYQVRPESLGDTGRSVRCVTCHTVWFEGTQEPPAAAAGIADADAVDPALIRPYLDDVIDIGSTPFRPLPADGSIDEPGFEDPATDIEAVSLTSPEAGERSDTYSPSPSMDADRAHIEPPNDIESIAARRLRRPASSRYSRNLARHAFPATICALVLLVGSLLAARQQVVRWLPQTASLYARIGLPVNLRGLEFGNIKTVRDLQDGVPTLVVEGEIIGTTGRLAEVPRLRFAVLDGAGKEIYAWTARPTRTLLPPGETLPFRSRLASPPAEASGVTVRFFNRRDAQAGFM